MSTPPSKWQSTTLLLNTMRQVSSVDELATWTRQPEQIAASETQRLPQDGNVAGELRGLTQPAAAEPE